MNENQWTPENEASPQDPVTNENASAPEETREKTEETKIGGETPPTGQNAASFSAPGQAPGAPYAPIPPKKPKKTVGWIVALSLLYLLLICGLFGLIFSGTLRFADRRAESGAQTESSTGSQEEKKNTPIKENPSDDGKTIVGENYSGEEISAVQIYENNVESVVFVQTTFARGAYTGSGFVIDAENGYILTNSHLVEGGSDFAVTFSNGDSYTAELIGNDTINDIAVLKIKASGLKNVTIGNSDDLKIGESIFVIGNPLGNLTFTMTSGILSGVDRSINTGEYNITTFQTDAAINNGSSGGPAFDSTGAVVGIASAKYAATGVEGICFCIPINDAMRVARDLVEHGYVVGRPNLGVTITDSAGLEYSTDEWGRRVIVETTPGARVEAVAKGSCAEKAGLKAGDIVTKLGDTEVKTANGLINAKNQYKAGDTVTLEVYRKGETITLTVTLDEFVPES